MDKGLVTGENFKRFGSLFENYITAEDVIVRVYLM
jgi:hypothetical protein